MFASLDADDLALVAEVSVTRAVSRAGEVVFREGDESNTCYVVRSGHARALREHARRRQIALATFGPGDIFGELAMFDDERRSATVETIDALEALAILGAGHAPADAASARARRRAGRPPSRAACARPTSGSPASPSRPCSRAWRA